MDTFRYYIALTLLVATPPQLLAWLIIHPFIRFWRRVNPALTYGVVGTAMGLCGAGFFLVRRSLLVADFGTNYLLAALGVLFNAAGLRLWVLLQRRLAFSTMAGLPELSPQGHHTGLITKGIYDRMRHPRYVQMTLSLWGMALIANYPAGYVMACLWLPGVYLIALLEEKELRDRYGAAYEEYCRRVPRFVPRFSRN